MSGVGVVGSGDGPWELAVDGLCGGYGEAVVLRQVSLHVRPGSVVALLGPNGAGKSTLMRIVAGLLRARSGSVTLNGQDVTRCTAERRASLGMCLIPEGGGIFPSLTVRDNLILQSALARADDAIQRVETVFPHLASRLNVKAGDMSGGEQQMLALSRAYLNNPRLVLVDEASLGLAPVLVESVFQFLESLARQGAALLIVEQFVHRALALAETVYVLNRGEIAFTGPPAALRHSDMFEQYFGASERHGKA